MTDHPAGHPPERYNINNVSFSKAQAEQALALHTTAVAQCPSRLHSQHSGPPVHLCRRHETLPAMQMFARSVAEQGVLGMPSYESKQVTRGC